jgi:Kef-type K+ transport system membrane component KefB
VTEHQLFVFLAEFVVLVAAARLGGEIATRLGVPQVVGELVIGVLLGPSLFGTLWSGGFHALFPVDPLQRALLEITGWIGVLFLVLICGLEMGQRAVRGLGRVIVGGWIGGFAVPFASGLALGMVVPGGLIGRGIERPVFALFLATAMSISAIPVIARILMDLHLLHTRLGRTILLTASADDTVGWILLGVVAGLATGNGLRVGHLVTTVGLTGLFVGLAFTVGPWLVRTAIRWSGRLRGSHAQTSVILLLVLTGGMITQAIGIHLVIGAFIAAILVGRAPAKREDSVQALNQVGMAVFVPFFFAYAGIKADMTTLTGPFLIVALVAIGVACASKFIGGGLGSMIGGLSRWEAAAVGVGLNARGAMELVIATVGLSLGILTEPAYSILVLVAVVTSTMAAPLLRFCARRAQQVTPGLEEESAQSVTV